MAAFRGLFHDGEKPKQRKPGRDPKIDPGVQQLLAQKIHEFHPDTEITQRCLAMMRFSDRSFNDSEKITILEMCNCYSPDSRRLALLNYIGYMRRQSSAEFNLAGALRRFRESPSNLIPVFSNEYIVENTNGMRKVITAPQKKPERPVNDKDDEL